MSTSESGLRIDRVVTHGIFALDGGEWEVDNNIWVLGDDHDCYIIDAAHDAEPIIEAVGNRNVLGVLCSHAHNDHVNVAPELARHFDTRIFLHPGDAPLWQETHQDLPFEELEQDSAFAISGSKLQVINTPGHSPGSCAFYLPDAKVLFSGDTLFAGGPGATGRKYSSFDTIIDSIRHKLLTLPGETEVYTGHGDATEIGKEAPHLQEWIARGH
ncbi:MBL fold metallo-hydrolase [Corynebacterium pelargi]|uniref:Putative polyketide biosynthesis zinc-dependent hydrolase BaeB n=1 Tax=Corynebacterium pelargi TaxID=1471400 RepID=A0A410W602_9CORY|nr:MBL fold metallo-hydrolase [Corynebacterium pelargi]QAU51382.1 putative polyketide biosynthesis zinc-dependent hydrolase BaeB [Corynebacterium pelargi]GGG81310.1 Zn-dependent hydrolase or glyoxylase [Corynebacterium pelargi]